MERAGALEEFPHVVRRLTAHAEHHAADEGGDFGGIGEVEREAALDPAPGFECEGLRGISAAVGNNRAVRGIAGADLGIHALPLLVARVVELARIAHGLDILRAAEERDAVAIGGLPAGPLDVHERIDGAWLSAEFQ